MATLITLGKLLEEHKKLVQMIAEIITKTTTVFTIPASKIELAHGESYAGVLLGKNGEKDKHIILLPGDIESINHHDAMKAGQLPTKRMQSLLKANLPEEFQDAAYWSCETHPSDSGYAFYQYFNFGHQDFCFKSGKLRARFIRILEIE